MSPVVTWEENEVGRGACLADGGDGGLDGSSPGGDVGDIVRLVHDAKCHLRGRGVLGGELRPERGELSVGHAGLPYDVTVPASVVVDVDDAEGGAGGEAVLHQGVVVAKVGGIEGAAEVVVDEVLPADRKAESVQAVLGHEVLHLGRAGGGDVHDTADGAGAVGTTAKVETS